MKWSKMLIYLCLLKWIKYVNNHYHRLWEKVGLWRLSYSMMTWVFVGYLNLSQSISQSTPPKIVLGHLSLSLLRLLLWWFSSEALSIRPRLLINEVSFVGKNMSRIMNCSNLQWVWNIWLFVPIREITDCIATTSHEINVFHVNLRFV